MDRSILNISPEQVRPDIVLYNYSQGIYKIVKHKSTAPRIFLSNKEFNHYDKKLDSSLSRAKRTILELGLCNVWKFFCTFTIAPDKYDRENLKNWHKDFSQWLRDQRKVHIKKGFDIPLRYVLVPELHHDGKSWHMHGLFSDITPVLSSFRDLRAKGFNVPDKLVQHNYYNWESYQNKFGFCSFGEIKNKVACGFYITKYVTKELEDSAVGVGLHTYYASRPLNRAFKHGEIYGSTNAFDEWLTNHYDFCDTGMTHVKDSCDWSFGFEYMDHDLIESISFDDPDGAPDVDLHFDIISDVLEQQCIQDFIF